MAYTLGSMISRVQNDIAETELEAEMKAKANLAQQVAS